MTKIVAKFLFFVIMLSTIGCRSDYSKETPSDEAVVQDTLSCHEYVITEKGPMWVRKYYVIGKDSALSYHNPLADRKIPVDQEVYDSIKLRDVVVYPRER